MVIAISLAPQLLMHNIIRKAQPMKQSALDKKYSKISPSLKKYFLENLYLRCMTIKEAATLCKLNYSTAKVVLRDLTPRELAYARSLAERRQEYKEREEQRKKSQCGYRLMETRDESEPKGEDSDHTECSRTHRPIEIISRVSFDVFASEACRI